MSRLQTFKNKIQNRLPQIEIDPVLLEGLVDVSKVALALLAIPAVVTIAYAMPGLAQVLSRAIQRNERKRAREIFLQARNERLGSIHKRYLQKSKQTLYYLRRQGYITFAGTTKDTIIEITKKGRHLLQNINLLERKPLKPSRWNRTWWIVLADIPTKTHRHQADHFRTQLKRIGFYTLQKTVWVYPYDPTTLLNNLTRYFEIGKYVTLVQAINIDAEDAKKLKKHFDL